MQNLVWKFTLIIVILALCLWALFAKEIRLGKDLRGGVSLIYRVSVPDDPGVDRQSVITQTITVLKDRVNPTGVLDIAIQPLGQDRIEVVMPLPNQAVRQLNDDYKQSLKDLLLRSQIESGELEISLQNGQAEERFCGDDREGPQCLQIIALQEAFDARIAAEQALSNAGPDADSATLATLEDAAARAAIEYDQRYQATLDLSLDRSRIVRAMGLSTKADPQRDANGQILIDSETGENLLKPTARDNALNALKADFPHVAGHIDTVVAAFDNYQKQRTGLDDPEDLKRLLRGAGVLEFHIGVDPNNPEAVNPQDMRQQLREVGPANVDRGAAAWYPINDLKQWYDGEAQLAALEADPATFFGQLRAVVEAYEGEYYMLLYTLPGKSLTHADDAKWSIQSTFRSVDQIGRPAVAFRLDPSGGTMMAKLTGAHVGQQMAIVLDGEVFSAPTLQSQISNNGIITGNFAQAELNYLIRVLAAGALEARLSPQPIAVNTLGPSIGADNLRRGQQAFIIAIIAVAILMLLYYFGLGVVADIALIANGIIIFGVMAMIDGTFTLPGLAGIVLTIGMAVDANVLIYERIREELFAGEEDVRGAVRLGYAKALSTIIDANVTNLIVCLVLFKTATTEVKGFALTLTIGICATLFTALFVTRAIYTLYLDVFKGRRLDMLPTVFPAVHRFLEPNINWLGLRKIFWTISAVAVIGSLGLVGWRGADMFDTEFRGGVTATMVTTPELGPDGQPLRNASGEIIRLQLAQEDVERRIQALGEAAADGTSQDQETLQQLRNADVLTMGDSQVRDGRAVADSFQIKVANPKGLDDEASITDVVVSAIVDEFEGEIDISPARTFEGAGSDNASGFVYPIMERDLGRVVGEPELVTRANEHLGGAAIVLKNLQPPATLLEISERIDQMRNQPDYQATAGRKTEVVGLTALNASDPDGAYRSVVVMVSEPNLSAIKVDTDVWYQQLAQPEWTLIGSALQRQSSLQQVSSFSSAVAETLSAQAIVAVTLSLLGILVYIWLRFGSLRYSAAAIMALVHDVCIALGLLALTSVIGRSTFGAMIGIAEFRIDLGVVAALLTIIGYSLNDTIVILDRIRENRGKRPLPTAEIVNRSINQTVSRTLLTSITTLTAVMIMYAKGGSGIRPFAFCLLVGLLVGTYSSVAIAAPLVFKPSAGKQPSSPGSSVLEREIAESAAS